MLQRLSYRWLRRATGGFAATNKLGQDGFSPVFRGALPVKGGGGWAIRPVVVKVMDAAGSLQGHREIHNEVVVASAGAGELTAQRPLRSVNAGDTGLEA
jgi:hypothetical protein